MSRVNVAILWHMHQPQYRDPTSGEYLLPWTRLHALKDYWGMVKILEEFPGVHVTFNFVPLLAEQIEEYASGNFKEPWFDIAFATAESLRPEQKRDALERAFQLNENYILRWPRYGELQGQVQSGGIEASMAHFAPRDWRDLQLLSQLAWMDEEYLAEDPVVSALAKKGRNFTEQDKAALRKKQMELLGDVLPEYRRAAERRQIEISTTPYYHPILPLLCDTDIARVANPHTPLPFPAFRHPEDAREQLEKAKDYHERVFGGPPAGLWPSEGSVSDEALEIAMEQGFQWFATDEGVLGRTRNAGFWRDASGYPENAPDLYTPWKLVKPTGTMSGFFRDHYLSDLVGFVYSRMDAGTAAEDLYRRIRDIGNRQPNSRPATVSIILDGENAWEHYPGNGREFLRQFYGRIEKDPEVCVMTMSEAMWANPEMPTLEGIFPASWINANFDVWIGHAEDVRAWELLRDARETYAKAASRAMRSVAALSGASDGPLKRAYEAVLAAEGSDWCWWYGPEHGTANDAEFDAIYRKLLTEIYAAIGETAPSTLATPIKRTPVRAKKVAPESYIEAKVDGKESSYFEWLGAGLYATERRNGTMHGKNFVLGEMYYGFGQDKFFVRVDPIEKAISLLPEFQVRLTVWDARETRITLRVKKSTIVGTVVEQSGSCLLHPEGSIEAGYGKILEVGIGKDLFDLRARKALLVSVALWEGGLPVDVLPVEGVLEVALGEENFAWASEPAASEK